MLNYLRFLVGAKHLPLEASRFSFRGDRSPRLRAAKTIALVGNGPLREGQATKIKACDAVIRFNTASNSGKASGYQTDVLVLVNHDWRRMARHSWQINLPVVLAAKEIWLPIDPQLMDQMDGVDDGPNVRNFSYSILERHGRFKPVRTVPAETYKAMAHEVGRRGGVPSSGLIVAGYLRQYYPAAQLNLFGFGHQGIHVHDWELERAAIDRMIRTGGVTRHPVGDS
ncbi:hypothetical protein [Devosia sp. A16]|uniref:hypothetical protein n=1 Tax=Devosia sp. A16 TaxID=1736675 RepID=UPI0006D770F3|nr:hypothetical protein [Devosia sp. A16]